MKAHTATRVALAAAALFAASLAQADAVTEWNAKAGEILTDAKMGTPPAHRTMAIAQTAVFEAVNAITRRYPGTLSLQAPADASVDAAVAAANRAVLLKALPAQQPAIDKAYAAALGAVADGAAKSAGIAVGEQAAAAVLAARADDGAGAPERYRPHAVPGAYVPTATPAAPQWAQRKPWLMSSPEQFRPGPPPALTSERWARDFDEIKTMGAKTGARRSAEQTEVAVFWEPTLPPIYHGVLRSVAEQPGRDVARNARLYAAAAQAMDDALIAVFDAKYHYHFWRPTTAIRNADVDGNDATERDAGWQPMIDTPMHPEYPSGHSILAGAVAGVLQAEAAGAPLPQLHTRSTSAKGATRRWSSLDAFVQEVSDARVWEGVHFRSSVDAGAEMGRRIGALAGARLLQPADTMAGLQP